MLFLINQTDLYERPHISGCVGQKVRRSQPGEPVRVLDCVPDFSSMPGGVTDNAGSIYHLAKERGEYLQQHTLDLVQVGEPPNVGFALVPRRHISDVPF